MGAAKKVACGARDQRDRSTHVARRRSPHFFSFARSSVEEVLHHHQRGRARHLLPTIVSHHEKPLIVGVIANVPLASDPARTRSGIANKTRGGSAEKGGPGWIAHDIHLPAADVEQLAPVVRPERSTAAPARDLPLAAVHVRERADEHLVLALLVRHVRQPTGIRRQRRALLVESRRHDPSRHAVHSRTCRENVARCRSLLSSCSRRARSIDRQDSRTRRSQRPFPRGAWVRRYRQRPAPTALKRPGRLSRIGRDGSVREEGDGSPVGRPRGRSVRRRVHA